MTGHRILFTISLLSLILIGYVNIRTGAHISMLLLYAVPVLLSSRYCGRVEGIVVALGATGSWLAANYLSRFPAESSAILSWNALTRFGILVLIAYSVSLQTRLRSSLKREQMMANTDRLTGLLSTGAFRERVEEEMNRARRYNHPLSLAFIDLDDFKEVNDNQGHVRGDKLIQNAGATIVGSIRNTDIAGRIGGDEFAVLLPETGEEQARVAIGKLIDALDIMTSQSGWQVTASIGVVTCTEIDETYDALLEKAGTLRRRAKVKGKNAAEFMTLQ